MNIRRIHSDVPTLRRGFTLVELMIVISIIAILVGIVIASSLGVAQRQQKRATRGLLEGLDRVLEEYRIATGAFPIYNVDSYEGVPGPDNRPVVFPASAGGDGELHPARPDAAVFLRQVTGFGEVDSIVREMPSRFMRVTIAQDLTAEQQDVTPSFVDTWAEPNWPPPNNASEPFPIRSQQVIYYVHPENLLAQALYGQCVNGRPYFMSAGSDRKYGLGADLDRQDGESDDAFQARVEGYLKDNIYSYEPVGPANRDSSFFLDVRSDPGL
jgi:prepilin-type N-terminal cleavage/methylation domain-containing protein